MNEALAGTFGGRRPRQGIGDRGNSYHTPDGPKRHHLREGLRKVSVPPVRSAEGRANTIRRVARFCCNMRVWDGSDAVSSFTLKKLEM